jgi:hypothetical protein
MLKWPNSRHFLVAAFSGAFVCLLILGSTFSASYGKCEGNRATGYSSPYNPNLGAKVTTFLVCQGETIDANGELLTALGTLAIAAFTLTLWLTSKEQGRLNQAALKLASDEFTATHRPKLFVQTVSSNIGGAPPHETNIEFIVVNGGEAKAYPIKALAFSYIQGDNSIFDPKEAAATPIFPEGKDLDPGQRVTLKVHSASIRTVYNDYFLPGQARMFVLGRVEYAGKDGIVRVTGFCREYSRETGAYAPVPNSEHEYAY